MLVVLVLLLLLLIAGQAAVEAFVGGLSRSCLPFDIQRRCVLLVSLAATQRDEDPQQQAEAEDSPENKKHVAFFAATTTTVVDHNDKSDYKDDDSDDSWKTGFGKNVEYLSLTLKQHKPLGCTVEESLSSVAATTTDQKKSNKQKKKTESLHYVFVTKVVEGGNACQAGILPGDVIIGVTATFGGGPTGAVENVAGLGMNKV
jgi:C-terminal processing protease CtpA/Prc